MKRLHAYLGSALIAALPTAGVAAQDHTYVYVSPNPIGVNKALQAVQKAVEQTAKDHSATTKTFEGNDPATRRDSVQAAIDLGAEVTVVFGFEFNDIITDLGSANPNTKFVMVDSCIERPTSNVYCGTFRQREVSYLVGAEAALTSRTGSIAVIGAVDIPYLHRYTDAYELGAKAARADIKVFPPLWVGGNNPFGDPVRANAQAQVQISQRVDRIFALTAGGNGGIFQAAAANKGVLAIGYDINQCPEQPGALIDSALQKYDVVIKEMVQRALDNSPKNVADFGLKEGGLALVGMAPGVASSQCTIVDFPKEVVAKLNDLKAKIASGEIQVPDGAAAK